MPRVELETTVADIRASSWIRIADHSFRLAAEPAGLFILIKISC
jgi:hypothetical protein